MFLHRFTEVYDIFAPFLPLLKQKKRKPKPAVSVIYFEILSIFISW